MDTKNNRAVLYIRLSKEDGDKTNKEDVSESIKNQRILLTDYAIEHDFKIIDVYQEDGFSGLYEDRPEFSRMIEDSKLGKFDIIICKTQNRFSREMAVVDKYINHMFPLMGIRFISVVDMIDNFSKGTKKNSQISSLTSEWYCEDLSDNIRAVFKQKMAKGDALCSFAPYGYLKDTKDKHKFIIDDYASNIVKRIFDLYLQGYGFRAICKILEDDKILPPAEYKQSQGFNYVAGHKKFCSKGLWSQATIKRILMNETYIGVLQQGKTKKASYKSKKMIPNKREDWIEVKNHHLPIISEDDFYKVQRLMASRRKVCNNQDKNKKCHPLSGKIHCAICGATMVKHNGNLRQLAIDKDSWYFACRTRRKTSGQGCNCKSILYRTVKNEILNTIYDWSHMELNDKNIKEIEAVLHSQNLFEEIYKLEKDIDYLNNKVVENINSIKTLYTDRLKGMIDDNLFIELKTSFETDNIDIKEKISKDYDRLKELKAKSKSKTDIKNIILKYKNITDLTTNIVNELIDDIKIGIDEEGNQTIDIHWNL